MWWRGRCSRGGRPGRYLTAYVRSVVSASSMGFAGVRYDGPNFGKGTMRTFGIVSAFIVGIIVWAAVFGLGQVVYPREIDGGVALLFWAPLVGTALPLAMLKFTQEAKMSGAWIVALAPLLGLLGILSLFLFAFILRGVPTSWITAICCIAWQLPWWHRFKEMKKIDLPDAVDSRGR